MGRPDKTPWLAKPPSFRAWLRTQLKRNDRIGDIARDVERDRGSRTGGLKALRLHIEYTGNDLAVKAFDATVLAWLRSKW